MESLNWRTQQIVKNDIYWMLHQLASVEGGDFVRSQFDESLETLRIPTR